MVRILLLGAADFVARCHLRWLWYFVPMESLWMMEEAAVISAHQVDRTLEAPDQVSTIDFRYAIGLLNLHGGHICAVERLLKSVANGCQERRL